MQNWKDKTWDEILKEQDKIKKSRNPKAPDWLNKEIEKEPITEEERKEFEDLLKEFKEDDNAK